MKKIVTHLLLLVFAVSVLVMGYLTLTAPELEAKKPFKCGTYCFVENGVKCCTKCCETPHGLECYPPCFQ